MKWFEVERAPLDSLLVRLGSGRRAQLLDKMPLTKQIVIRFLDSDENEKANPSDFSLAKAPVGTVPRIS